MIGQYSAWSIGSAEWDSPAVGAGGVGSQSGMLRDIDFLVNANWPVLPDL